MQTAFDNDSKLLGCFLAISMMEDMNMCAADITRMNNVLEFKEALDCVLRSVIAKQQAIIQESSDKVSEEFYSQIHNTICKVSPELNPCEWRPIIEKESFVIKTNMIIKTSKDDYTFVVQLMSPTENDDALCNNYDSSNLANSSQNESLYKDWGAESCCGETY